MGRAETAFQVRFRPRRHLGETGARPRLAPITPCMWRVSNARIRCRRLSRRAPSVQRSARARGVHAALSRRVPFGEQCRAMIGCPRASPSTPPVLSTAAPSHKPPFRTTVNSGAPPSGDAYSHALSGGISRFSWVRPSSIAARACTMVHRYLRRRRGRQILREFVVIASSMPMRHFTVTGRWSLTQLRTQSATNSGRHQTGAKAFLTRRWDSPHSG